MDANFFHYFIYDRFIQRQPCACMRAFVNFFFFSLKNFSSETMDWIFTKFHKNVPLRLKTSLHRYRKIRPVERYRRSSAFSFTLFNLYRGGQCTFPCFPGIVFTSIPIFFPGHWLLSHLQ